MVLDDFTQLLSMTPKMCLDLEPRSYLQGQGAHIPEISVQCHCQVGSRYFTVVVHHTRMCYNFDPRSNIPKICLGRNASLPSLIWIFHTLIVHDRRVCHDLDKSYLKGQGHTYPNSVSGPQLLTAKLDLDISHNCCPYPKGVS